MELLLLLAESDGRLVSREEIEERLWGKEVFVDAEHGINTAIRKIRQVLGDDPDNPRFVQTVQRKGYRFIAEVSQVPDVPAERNGIGTVPEPANQSVPLPPKQDPSVEHLPSASASALSRKN